MKKFSTILLLMFFLIANSSVAVQLHWCGGKITNIDINCESESKCSCGSEMAAGCCKDVHVKIKMSNCDYQASITKIIFSKTWSVPALSISKLLERSHFYPSNTIAYSSYHAPPVLKGPVFLLYCNILV